MGDAIYGRSLSAAADQEAVQLTAEELTGLGRIAEGRPDEVPPPVAARLVCAGLVLRRARAEHASGEEQRRMLELTALGLRRIRSSDQ